MTAAAPATTAPDRKRGLTLVAMTGALSMILIDETVVSVALPSIQRDLDLSATTLQWVVNAYLLTLAAFVALAGRLSDTLGRVRFFVLGVGLFALASVGSGFATEAWHIIASRAVQGVGAAMMIPSSQAIVVSSFPLKERGRAMGIYAGISMGFLALGPLIGGVLTQSIGWEWVFFVNVPVAALTLGLTFVARPVGDRTPAGRFDLVGTFLLIVGLSAAVYALMESSASSWGDPVVVTGLVGGGVLLVAFVLYELRIPNPLVQFRIMRSGNFSADCVVLFLVQFALVGVSVFGSIYFQDVLGLSPMRAGAALLPLTIPVLIVAAPVGKLYDRTGPRSLVTLGCLFVAAAFAATAVVVTTFDYWWFVPGYVVLGVGVALIMTPSNTDAMNAAPAADRGEASGLLQTIRQVGGTFGIAVLTTLILRLDHNRLDSDLAGEFPGKIARKIEGVLAEAQGGNVGRFERHIATEDPSLSASERQDLLDRIIDAAHDAFAYGLRVGFLILAVLLFIAAVVAFVLLRKVDYSAIEAAPEPVGPHPVPHASPHPPAPPSAEHAPAGVSSG